jgi:muramoyltetrapeptide carboxypeptidase
MLKPRAIKPGDTLSVVSPASPVERHKMQNAVALFEGRGYKLKFGKNAFAADGHLAGTDEQRAKDFSDAWFDEDTAAVICSRGGYGCARLAKHLNFDAFVERPKLLVGFSDITTIHVALNRRGLATLYAPMFLTFAKDREPWVCETWFAAMEGTTLIELPGSAPRAQMIVGGRTEGVVAGGCLVLLCDSLGTPEAFDCAGKIVLIEDVDEAPHRVDAMLTHLLNAGVLQRAAGIVVGEMTGSDEKLDAGIGGKPWRNIVCERIGGLGIPSVAGFPFGHCQNMMSLPLGVAAELDADAGTLVYKELGVQV